MAPPRQPPPRQPGTPPKTPNYRADDDDESPERTVGRLTEPARRMVEDAPKQRRSGGKITIACKLPVPWIDLTISKLVDKDIPGLNGTVTRKEAIQTGRFIRIRGTAYPRAGGVPDGFPGKPIMMAGFALTLNVDEDEWNAFLACGGREMDMVRNGIVFAYPDLANIKARCTDLRDVKTGLEPLDPRTDPNTGRSLDGRVRWKNIIGQDNVHQVNEESGSEEQLYKMLEQQEAAVAAREE